jgi:hypothetical protein
MEAIQVSPKIVVTQMYVELHLSDAKLVLVLEMGVGEHVIPTASWNNVNLKKRYSINVVLFTVFKSNDKNIWSKRSSGI